MSVEQGLGLLAVGTRNGLENSDKENSKENTSSYLIWEPGRRMIVLDGTHHDSLKMSILKTQDVS